VAQILRASNTGFGERIKTIRKNETISSSAQHILGEKHYCGSMENTTGFLHSDSEGKYMKTIK
jgi:hypothetical protein